MECRIAKTCPDGRTQCLIKNAILILLVIFGFNVNDSNLMKLKNLIIKSHSNNCPTPLKLDEECSSKFLYFGKRDVVLALDDEHYQQNCNLYEEGMNCLENYIDNCLSGIPRIAAEVTFRTVQAQFKRRCEDPNIKQPFIEHSQCLRNETILEQFHQCGDRYFHMVTQLHNVPDKDWYTSAACCLMAEYDKCLDRKNFQLCNDHVDDGRFWSKVFNEMSGEAQLYCYEYESHENCLKNFPRDIWRKIVEPVDHLDPETLRKRDKFLSLFFTNVDIANKFQL